LVRSKAGYAGFGVNDSNGRSVASFPSSMKRDVYETAANAVLIAAAPELAAFLLRVLKINGSVADIAEGLAGVQYEGRALLSKLNDSTPFVRKEG
jgi:argininosuccinate synthase